MYAVQSLSFHLWPPVCYRSWSLLYMGRGRRELPCSEFFRCFDYTYMCMRICSCIPFTAGRVTFASEGIRTSERRISCLWLQEQQPVGNEWDHHCKQDAATAAVASRLLCSDILRSLLLKMILELRFCEQKSSFFSHHIPHSDSFISSNDPSSSTQCLSLVRSSDQLHSYLLTVL